MTQEHYFSANPNKPAKLNQVEFDVAGVNFNLNASSGTFSGSRLDPGTRVLLGLADHFPTSGKVLDLGCGWGPIGISIARLAPETQVIGVDVNQRSLGLANANAELAGITNFTAVLEGELDSSQRFDHIWSNPPIRIGKDNLHKLLDRYLALLKPGGSAFMVVQKQLGAESLQRWLAESLPEREVTKVENSKGFRVIRIGEAKSQ